MDNRKISFVNAVALGVNILVGAGVLAGPSATSAIGGPAAFLVWIVSALILSPVVYTTSRLPEVLGQGGFAHYCRQGLGRFWGFLGAWIYLVSYVFAVTGIIAAFRDFFLIKFNSCAMFSPVGAFFAAALGLLLLFNLLPEIFFARLAGALTMVKLAPVAIAIIFAPFFLKNAPVFCSGDVQSVFGAIPLSIFAFVGFDYLCNFSDKIEGGIFAARKAILTTFACVSVLYFAFHYSLLSIMGREALVHLGAPGYAPFIAQVFPSVGQFLALVLPVATIVTYLNGSNCLLLLNSNMLSNFARAGQIRFASLFDQRISTGRPLIAVLVACLGSYLVAVVVGDTAKLMIGCVFVQMLILALVMGLLIRAECQRDNTLEKLVSYVALAVCLGLAAFCWFKIADCNYDRMVALSPFFVGLLLGLVLYNGCNESGARCSNGCVGQNCNNNCSRIKCSK